MQSWILKLLSIIMPLVSPEIKKALGDLLTDLKKKAQQTSNPWDDMIVDVLLSLIGK